jgi:hypothetical protein
MNAVDGARLDRSAFQIAGLHEDSDERDYWKAKSPAERMEALELIGRLSMATIQLPPDFKEFLRLLNSSSVEYLVIGGYAVNYYGFPRATADL